MRIFGGDKLFAIFNSPMFASIPADEPLAESAMLTKRITTVQKQVEGRNFDIRKHILEYDDVLNQHRLVMYGRRNRILENEDIHSEVMAMFSNISERFVTSVDFTDTESDISPIERLIQNVNAFADREIIHADDVKDPSPEMLGEYVNQAFNRVIEDMRSRLTPEEFFGFEKSLVLISIDELWMNHIDAMAHLREEVAFEGYAQKNPLVVYKERAYTRFVELIENIEYKVTK